MSLDWNGVAAFALSLPGVELSTSYGQPAVKVNGRTFVNTGHEDSSFCLHIDMDTVLMLKETEPGTYWQSPHYEGWPAVLVRFDTDDAERVHAMIERAHAWQASKPKPRSRKKA